MQPIAYRPFMEPRRQAIDSASPAGWRKDPHVTDPHVIVDLDAAPDLPHVEEAASRLSNWIMCRAAPVPLRIGDVDWTLRFVAEHAAGANHANPYVFTLGPAQGRLCFDTPSERWLLGSPGAGETLPPLLRHALMADTLADVATRLVAAQPDAFAWQNGHAAFPSNAQRFPFVLTTAAPATQGRAPLTTLRGVLELDKPERLNLLPEAIPDGSRARWVERLRIPVAIRIGTTQIAVGEMHDVRPGDILSIESWQSQGSALLVRCTTGRRGLQWQALAEGSRITIKSLLGEDMEDRTTGNEETPHPDAAQSALNRLDNLEVTLRFEVGDVAVPLSELRTVRQGYVFELPQPLKQSEVRVVANGRVIGTGTLIAVGNRLGVRVTNFASDEG